MSIAYKMNTDTCISTIETDPLCPTHMSALSLNATAAYYSYLNAHIDELLHQPAFMLSTFYKAHELLVLLKFEPTELLQEQKQELINFTNACDEKYEHVFRDRSAVMQCPEFIRYKMAVDRLDVDRLQL